MKIKIFLIATVATLTSINANARCKLGTKFVPYGYSFTAANVASAANSAPTGKHATSYTCSIKNMYSPYRTYDTQTVLAGDSYTPEAELCDPKDSTVRYLECTVASSEYNTFSVSYSSGGGTGSAPSAPTSCTYNDTCNAPANTYTYADHILTGWACTKSNGTSCGTFTVGQSISTATTTNNDTITLTAQWVDALPFKTPTSKSYVDSKMNALQPQFSGLGANKLMTYGTTAGAVGSRDIVTTLGDSKTANTIPTRGAIQTALDTKQDTMNGTAGWVVENTGTAGILKGKPIYSTTNNYRQALVEADDLNQIVTDAVNSELIRVDETGEPNANGTLWKLNDAANLTLPTLRWLLDSSINGTSGCSRHLSGTSDNNGTCSAATLATLGATGNKSGLWGAVFPYGEVVGKSVCSSLGVDGSYRAATPAENDTLNGEFSTQSGTGQVTSSQSGCWCKVDSIGGDIVSSSWVAYIGWSSSSSCKSDCTAYCSSIWYYEASDYRHNLFEAIQQ